MSRLSIRKATLDEAELITAISVRSFATDADLGGGNVGGPPCYDSVEWHRQCIQGDMVYAVCLDEELIGCAILLPDEENKTALSIGRIFLEPRMFRKGYGLELMQLIEKTFCDVSAWTLDTPVWNTRTNNFYQKLGYTEVNRNQYLCFYRKENPKQKL